MRTRDAVAMAVATVAISGCGAAQPSTSAAGPTSADPPPWASTASGTPVQFTKTRQELGPGMSADQAAQQALLTLGDPTVTSATVIDAPSGSGGSGEWLSVGIDSNLGDSVKQDWLAQLMQGAVDDLMRTNQTTTTGVLDGAQLVDRNQSGKTVVTYLGHGSVVGGQLFESPSDEALRQQVQAAAEKYGLKIDSVQILHPLESALVVTMTVPDGPLHGWNLASLDQAIEGGVHAEATGHTGVIPNVEGLYLELRDPSGRPVLKSSYAFRIPSGSAWTSPGQDDRFGIEHG